MTRDLTAHAAAIVCSMVVIAACALPSASPPPSASAPSLPAQRGGLPLAPQIAESTATSEEKAAEVAAVQPTVPATAAPTRAPVVLHDWGPAPELTNDVWLNSEPLRLANLRGKVVMIEFWTYG